jgi:hypothetical protein
LITAAIAYIAAAAFAAGLLVGGYVAWDWLGAKEYKKGYVMGSNEEQDRSKASRDKLELQLKADALAIQIKETARVKEIDRIKQAAVDAGRAQYHEEREAARTQLDHLLTRMRAAEATARSAIRHASSGSGLSSPNAAAGGADRPAAGRVLSEQDREDIAGLMNEAEEVARKYRKSLTHFPVSPPPTKSKD